MPDVFEDVRVSVIRPAQIDPDGLCGDYSPREDVKTTSLPLGGSCEPHRSFQVQEIDAGLALHS